MHFRVIRLKVIIFCEAQTADGSQWRMIGHMILRLSQNVTRFSVYHIGSGNLEVSNSLTDACNVITRAVLVMSFHWSMIVMSLHDLIAIMIVTSALPIEYKNDYTRNLAPHNRLTSHRSHSDDSGQMLLQSVSAATLQQCSRWVGAA